MLTFHLTSEEGQREKAYSVCGNASDGVGFAMALKPPKGLYLWLTSKVHALFTKCHVLLDCWDRQDGEEGPCYQLIGKCFMNYSYPMGLLILCYETCTICYETCSFARGNMSY